MNREPNALDAAALLARDLVYGLCITIILAAPFVFWIITPAGMQ
jgi:hypothetical protein